MRKRVKRLLRWKPDAINIVEVGDCPGCKLPMLKFYQTPDYAGERTNTATGQIDLVGGYYCEGCGWGNAGTLSKAAWEELRGGSDAD